MIVGIAENVYKDQEGKWGESRKDRRTIIQLASAEK